MTASVPPDREAAVQQVAVALANVSRLPEWMQIPALGRDMRPIAEVAVTALWPLICQAREQHQRDLLNLRARLEAEHEEMQERAYEDGKAEGRREAAPWQDAAERYRDLAVRAIDVHAEVGMDSPEDKALHAKAIETFHRYLDAIDEGARLARVVAQQPDEKERTDGRP